MRVTVAGHSVAEVECVSDWATHITVESADHGAAAKAFVALPYELYRHDPLWVPPLRFSERRRWSPQHNPALADRTVRRFVALRKGVVAGRIAAILDSAFATRWENGAACFGFFESINDRAVARALFRAAERTARAWGATRLVGPINLTTHDETGFLVEGFDSSPMVQSPYNPRWYPELVRATGYEPYREYSSYLRTPAAEPGDAVRRLVRAAATGHGFAGHVRIRAFDPAQWDRDVRIFCELYNASFAGVWGFVPISWEEFAKRAEEFRPFLIPRLALVAELGGEPVGFSLTLPDANVALRAAGGRLWPFGWLRIARAIPRIKQGRFILLGVRPGRTGCGIAALLADHTREAVRDLGWKAVELSLVQGANKRVRHVIDAFGCPHAKTYRLYLRSLDQKEGTNA